VLLQAFSRSGRETNIVAPGIGPGGDDVHVIHRSDFAGSGLALNNVRCRCGELLCAPGLAATSDRLRPGVPDVASRRQRGAK